MKIFDTISRIFTRNDHATSINAGVISSSGELISNQNAINDPTVSTCVRIIQGLVAQLPWYVLDGDQNNAEKHNTIIDLLNKPNGWSTSRDFKSSIIFTLLCHGNCFILVDRYSTGIPYRLTVLDSEGVEVKLNKFGVPEYTYGDKKISYTNMCHIKDIPTNTLLSESRVFLAKESIGNLRSARTRIGKIMKDGLGIKTVVTSRNALNNKQRGELLEAVKKAISDDGTMIVSNADVMQFKGSTPMEMSIKSLIDTEIGVIAGVFGLSPHLIGGSGDQKYNNVRQKQTAMYKDTLQPILIAIEEALSRLLLPDNYSIKFDVTGLLKGDVDGQSIYTDRLVRLGLMSINEGRGYMGLDAVTDGDKRITIEPAPAPKESTGGEDGQKGNGK